MIVIILFSTMWLTRRRDYRILGGKPGPYRQKSRLPTSEARSSDELMAFESDNEDDNQTLYAQEKRLPKTRWCCGLRKINTPNSSRFKNHIHSRILQKLPFLVEMFYWIITYAAYHWTQQAAMEAFKGEEIWNVAEQHAVTIMNMEEHTWLRHFLPCHEKTVQQFFMHGHQDALTFVNRAYSLVHIPGTIGFIGWYYYSAPSHPTFATVRRTLTLTNYFAFILFTFYPLMPPRLLPKEYGYLDTVHHDDAASVWMSGKYVNQLAAMPSMHFGYAFAIGSTLIYHSGVFRKRLEKYETRKTTGWKLFYCFLGVFYPSFILLVILATANHYWLDAIVAFFCVLLAFACNRIFLALMPLEDLLLWAWRLEKPIPSTGERFHARGGRL